VSEILAPVRICSRCHEPKPVDAFRRDSRGYLRSHCIPCCLIDSQEWRARHHAQLLDRRRAQRAAHGGGGTHTGDRTPGKTAPSLSTHSAEFRRVGRPTATSPDRPMPSRAVLGRREVP